MKLLIFTALAWWFDVNPVAVIPWCIIALALYPPPEAEP